MLKENPITIEYSYTLMQQDDIQKAIKENMNIPQAIGIYPKRRTINNKGVHTVSSILFIDAQTRLQGWKTTPNSGRWEIITLALNSHNQYCHTYPLPYPQATPPTQ